VVAAGVGAPLALLAGRWVGTLAANTVLAALPALLLVAVLPPLAVVGAAVRLGGLGPRPRRVGLAVGVAIGAQVLVLVGAVWLGASARRLGDTALLTLVEAGVLPTAVTWVLRRAAAGRGG
jgi:hypothetical protein